LLDHPALELFPVAFNAVPIHAVLLERLRLRERRSGDRRRL
jgi:hypothetical protein